MCDCLLRRYSSAVACCRDRGSGCSRPGYGINSLGRGHQKCHHGATRTYTGLGKQTPGGHKQNLVCTRIQEKGAVTSQETDTHLTVSVQESLCEVRSVVACCRPGGTECSSARMGHFEEGHHYLHYLHHSLASGHQTTGREHGNFPPISRKLD